MWQFSNSFRPMYVSLTILLLDKLRVLPVFIVVSLACSLVLLYSWTYKFMESRSCRIALFVINDKWIVIINDNSFIINDEWIVINDEWVGLFVINDKWIVFNDNSFIINDKWIVINDNSLMINSASARTAFHTSSISIKQSAACAQHFFCSLFFCWYLLYILVFCYLLGFIFLYLTLFSVWFLFLLLLIVLVIFLFVFHYLLLLVSIFPFFLMFSFYRSAVQNIGFTNATGHNF